MNLRLAFSILLIFGQIGLVQANEICSRVAIIDFQEVLVDTNTTQKGEGLRYHLKKDPVARLYLDRYQEGTQIKWYNAITGTVGSALFLSGVMARNASSKNRRTLMLGGIVLIATNFLMAKTSSYSNELNLYKAIEEYNKRNLPRIYFNPIDQKNQENALKNLGITLSKTWDF